MDPKEYYNKIINNKEVKETIENSKKVKEMTDEIYDESYEERYTEIDEPDKLEVTEEGYVKIPKITEARYSIPVFENPNEPSTYCFIPEVPTIKVRYHKELCPDLVEMEKIDKGDFIDLRAAETVDLKAGEFKLISLGISIQLPKGYHAEVVPRSSTFKNFGIIMTNSIGIIDESYCGDNDIWRFPALAMRGTKIKINDRICQFRVVKNRDINIEIVDKLDNEDRGGIGSTGKN